MLIQFIRNDKRLSSAFLLGGFVLLALAAVLGISEPISLHDAVPDHLINKSLNSFTYLFAFASLIGIYGLGVLLHRLSKDHFLSNRNYFLSPWFFIWTTTAWYGLFNFDLAILIIVLLGISLNKLLKLFNEPRPQTIMFDSGALVGIASLLYPPAAIYLIWICLAPIVYQNYKARYFMLAILGFACPVLLCFLIQFLADVDYLNWDQLIAYYTISFPSLDLNYFQLAFFFVYITYTAVFLLELVGNISKKPIRERKSFVLASTFILFTILGCFIAGANMGTQLVISGLGTCFVWANYFTHSKNFKRSNALLILWMISLVLFVLS